MLRANVVQVDWCSKIWTESECEVTTTMGVDSTFSRDFSAQKNLCDSQRGKQKRDRILLGALLRGPRSICGNEAHLELVMSAEAGGRGSRSSAGASGRGRAGSRVTGPDPGFNLIPRLLSVCFPCPL